MPKEKQIEWKEARKNLLEMLEKYPHSAVDIIDSAYLAGLEAEKDQFKGISEWRNYGEARDYFKFFEDKIKKELIEEVKGMMGGEFQLTGGGQKKKGIALGWNSHRGLVIKKLNKLIDKTI